MMAGCRDDRQSETSFGDNQLERVPIPPAATNLVTRAQMAMSEGQYAAAMRGVDEAIRRAPNYSRAHFMRGQLLTRMDSLDSARNSFEFVRAIDPDYPAILFNLGNNAVLRRQYEDALIFYREERSRMPAEAPDANRVALLMQMGNVFRELGEADSARAAFQKVIARDERSDLAYDALGQVYQEEGELENALEARKRALELNPNNGGYAYHVGSLLFQLGRPADAIEYLEQSKRKLPWFYGSSYNLGRSMIALGRTVEGERYLTLADSLQERQGELGLAKARAEARGTPSAWLAYADMLYEDERYEEALQAYLDGKIPLADEANVEGHW